MFASPTPIFPTRCFRFSNFDHHGSRSPSTPTGANAYQVNVNRTKTKKWVEAKVQNYDGDDWGADEFDDEDGEPEPAPPLPQFTTRTGGSRDSTLPSLQTQHHSTRSVSLGYTKPEPVSSPNVYNAGGALPHRAQTASPPPTGVISEPTEQKSVEAASRSSNINNQDGDQEQKEPTALDSMTETHPQISQRSVEVGSVGGKDEISHHVIDAPDRLPHTTSSPKLPNLARISAFGIDLFSPSEGGISTEESIPEQAIELPSSPPAPTKAEVVSSTFEAQKGSSQAGVPPVTIHSQDEEVKQSSASEKIKDGSSIVPPETASVPDAVIYVDETNAKKDLPATSHTHSTSLSKESIPILHPDSDMQMIPPLRTPSPRGSPMPAPAPESTLEVLPAQREEGNNDASPSAEDNDLLSDAILKSLSTQGEPAHDARAVEGHPDISNRQLMVDTSKNQPDVDHSANVIEAEPVLSPQSASLRRRFSWEAGEAEDADPSNAAANPLPVEPLNSSSQPHEPVEDHSTPSFNLITHAEEAAPSRDGTPKAVAVSSQISTSSSIHPGDIQQPGLEVVTPISPASEKPADRDRPDSKSSAADETPLGQSISLVSSTPPPEANFVVAADQPLVSPAKSVTSQIMPFKDIMTLNTPRERIAKYNETRNVFSSTNSGLDEWLAYVQAQQSSAASDGLFGAQLPRVTEGVNAAAPAGSQASSAQQPYYQQYLNASSPGSSMPTNRSRIASLPIPTPGSGSTFGSSGNQIGTKGKELMQSAGKMGKGLLSKGRSKLRGTGDKGESPSLAHQLKSKADWRTSWSLGTRSRTERHETPQAIASPGAFGSAPIATSTWPSSTAPESHSNVSEWGQVASKTTDRQDLSLRHSALHTDSQSHSGSRTTAGLSKLEIPTSEPLSTTQADAPTLPLSNADQEVKNDLDTPQQTTAVKGNADNTWNTVSKDEPASKSNADAEADAVNSKPAPIPAPAPALPVSEDSGVAFTSQSQGPTEPKRESSFIGLPPIRRSSTFGLSSRSKARRATDRFPIDDDDDDMLSNVVTNEQEATEVKARPPAATQPVTATTKELTSSVPSVDKDRAQASVVPSGHEVAANNHDTQIRSPSGILNQQHFASGGVPPAAPNPQPRAYPTQTLPMSGQWKLEESHLSEPLNPVARSRPGVGGSQLPYAYGFDKETGMPYPEPNLQQFVPAATGPPPRQRSDVPPSSAQRWPELFAQPEQRPRVNSHSGSPPYQPPYRSLARNEFVMPRTETSEFAIPGVGPPEEDRGRTERNSGLFKELGQRISRATSRERRDSFTDKRQSIGDSRGNESLDFGPNAAIESQQQTRRLSGRFGRASMDQSSIEQQGTVKANEGQDSPQQYAPSQASEKRASFFGAGMVERTMFGRISRSSTSNLSNEAALKQEDAGTNPQKKRHSLANRMSSLFNLRGQDDKPDQQEGPLDPPAPPFKLLARPASATFSSMGSQERPRGDQGRRSSVSSLLSGMLGRRPDSKSQDVDTDSTLPAPTQQPLAIDQTSTAANFQAHSAFKDGQTAPLDSNLAFESGAPVIPNSAVSGLPFDGMRLPPVDVDVSLRMDEAPGHLSEEPVRNVESNISSHMERVSTVSPTTYEDMEAKTQEHQEEDAKSDKVGRSYSIDLTDELRNESAQVADTGLSNRTSPSIPEPTVYKAEDKTLLPAPTSVTAAEIRPQLHQAPARDGIEQRQQDIYDGPRSSWSEMTQQEPKHAQHRPEPYHVKAPQAHKPEGQPIPVAQDDSKKQQTRPGQGSVASAVAAQRLGMKWKGFKSKVSEQASQFGQQISEARQGKGDKTSGNKFLPALKRNSRAFEAQIHRAFGHEGGPPQPTAQRQNEAPHQQPMPPQPAHGQQVSEQSQIPHPDMTTAAPPQWRMSQGHGQLPRQTGQQIHPQRHSYQQYAGHYRTDPRYDQGPNLQNYGANWEDMRTSSPYNADGHISRTSTQSQHRYSQQGYDVLHRESVSPIMSHASVRHDSVSSLGLVGPSSPKTAEDTRANLGWQSMRSNEHYHVSRQTESPQPMGSHTLRHVCQGDAGPVGQTAQHTGSVTQRAISRGDSSPHESTMESHNKRLSTLSVDIGKAEQYNGEDIYDATPRLMKSHIREASGASGAERMASDSNLAAAKRASREMSNMVGSPAAELADTADAHERRIRLQTQEEKIWCDPEDDPNYQPQMSATSYPGQEWNPYGDAEYADWKDE